MSRRLLVVLVVTACGRHDFAERPDAGPVSAGDPVVQLSGGGSHTCALTAAGEVWCWGDGKYDALGPPTTTARGPTRVALAEPVHKVFVGEDTTCVLAGAAPDLLCWGHLPGADAGDPTPRRIDLPGPVAAAAVGERHWCAVLTDQSVWCWGVNTCGGLGDGTTTTRPAPGRVLGPGSGATALSITDVQTCALVADQPVCWGAPWEGTSGCIQSTATPTASPLPAGRAVAQLTGGCHMHTCARAVDGTVWCLGQNGNGQLGDGTTASRTTWGPVTAFGPDQPALEVQAGAFHTCARTGDGVWCWGRNASGELGQAPVGPDGPTPRAVPALAATPVGQLVAGCGQTCVLTEGHVDCFGENDRMQLGDLTIDPSAKPVRVRVGLDR